MKEEEDRTATKLEEQVALLTETVAQLTVMLEMESMLVSALLYNHRDMEIPDWKEHKKEYEEVVALGEKIIEANKANGQRKADKS